MAFENIIGNNGVKNILQKTINLNNVLHSYMFIGPSGIGKKLFAKEFAKMILCTGNEVKPCNNCKACIEFESENNPDFKIIEPLNGSIKIEQIRSFQEKVIEKPITSNKKVYIINNSDTMTKEAQNCLLKTLEEPPEFVTIILIGSNENLFLNTIKSRCTKIVFNKIDDEELKKILENKFNITNITQNMLEVFSGSIEKALLLKDKGEIYTKVEDIFNKMQLKDLVDILNDSEIIYKNKEDIIGILEFINILLFNKAKINVNDSEKYIKCIQIVEKTKKNLNSNSNFDMSIDNLLFETWEELNK